MRKLVALWLDWLCRGEVCSLVAKLVLPLGKLTALALGWHCHGGALIFRPTLICCGMPSPSSCQHRTH